MRLTLRWPGHGIVVAIACLASGCVSSSPRLDDSMAGRGLPVAEGRIYPVAWQPLDHFELVFERGQTGLTDKQIDRLQHWGGLLSDGAALLVVVGFARDGWSDDHNRVMAEARALAVRRVFLLAGIGRERLQTVSLGREFPPGWPDEEELWPNKAVGGRVRIAEALVPLEAWIAAGGEVADGMSPNP